MAEYITPAEAPPRARPCAFCAMPIYGDEGGWHDILGFEHCAGSPTSFHEPCRDLAAAGWVERSKLRRVGWIDDEGEFHYGPGQKYDDWRPVWVEETDG